MKEAVIKKKRKVRITMKIWR